MEDAANEEPERRWEALRGKSLYLLCVESEEEGITASRDFVMFITFPGLPAALAFARSGRFV